MRTTSLAIFTVLLTGFGAAAPAASPIRVLIIDGQNNHDWQHTTPALKKILEEAGLFDVTVLTSPPKGADFTNFVPEFQHFQVVVLNYNDFGGGTAWPEPIQRDFETFVHGGGGFVSYHAADNAFPDWKAYNLMIGVGGWMGRNEVSGPYWYFQGGSLVSEASPGLAGSHGARKPFQITVQNVEHPIMKGLPQTWMHAADELYSRLRGPGGLTVLATAYSDPDNHGSGHDEPMLMVLRYGKGRIFHTTLGHDVPAMESVDFITTFARGVEWAANGKVTLPVPADFPTADHVSTRNLSLP